MILAAAPAEEAGLSEVAAAQPADLPEELGFPDPEDVMGRMAVHQTPEWLTVADDDAFLQYGDTLIFYMVEAEAALPTRRFLLEDDDLIEVEHTAAIAALQELALDGYEDR